MMILFEDDDLLVVNKPAGMNTHAPAFGAGEGLYEWLRNREPRWASLAIIHRLDKETSGVMVFGKTPRANRSLTEQFAAHGVRKRYRLVTDRPVAGKEFTVASTLVRAGDRYVSRPLHAGGDRAETRFRVLDRSSGRTVLEAEPVTGRTHQIRVHAAVSGLPILGDILYKGTTAPRVFLHAERLTLKHPGTHNEMSFSSRASVDLDARLALREAIVDPAETNAFRVIHGDGDGWPEWYVDRLGSYLLSQSDRSLTDAQRRHLEFLNRDGSVYHKILVRQIRRASPAEASPQLILGKAAPERFSILENGVRFELSFNEGYSVGLFLDQRDNRRRFRTTHVAAGFPVFDRSATGRDVLNAFAYTCGFSVCAAKAGVRTTSLDLSKKYLEWGRRNFALNGLEPSAHDFIHGDAFGWFRRLAKKRQTFDAIVLDPPTFSQSKEHGIFRAEKDYGDLVAAALPLLKSGGVLLASTNAAELAPKEFLATVTAATTKIGRRVTQQHYVSQPPDFPISRAEPAYLKTVWLRVA